VKPPGVVEGDRARRAIERADGDGTANTGPTDILAFDPKAASFRVETTIDEEAVTTFRIIGDRLFVPGIDPLGAAENGALHVRERGTWRSVTVPAAVHVQDVIVWDGRLFVALQQKPNRAVVLTSKNDGATWRNHPIAGWRAHTFFTVDDALYVSAFGGGVSQAHGKSFRSIQTDLGPVPPPSKDGNVDRWAEDSIVSKAARCGASTWVIAAVGSVAYGYTTPTLERIRREGAKLVSTSASIDGRPEDFFVWNDRCHVVTNDTADEPTTIRIYRANDDAWDLVAETSARAIARSALRVDGHWYLGLACDAEGGEDAGHLARLPAAEPMSARRDSARSPTDVAPHADRATGTRRDRNRRAGSRTVARCTEQRPHRSATNPGGATFTADSRDHASIPSGTIAA